MKTNFLLLASLVLGLSSCTTAYKTGQTPDDVYYSPTRTIGSDEVREEERREDDRYYANEEQGDRYLRYRVRDRRWNSLDDDYWRFGYNTYGYNYTPYNNSLYFNNGFGNGFGNRNPWYNNNYNPYCPIPVGPSNPTFGNGYGYTPPRVFKPRSGGLGGYGGDYNNGNGNGGKPGTVQRPVRLYGNRNYNNSNNNGGGLGESIRKVFTGSGTSNSNSNSNDRPVRSYEPSPSNNNNNNGGGRSGGSGGGSGGGGGISRPARGGR